MGTCPTCGSRELIRVPGNFGYDTGDNIAAGRAIWQRVKVAYYVCRRCGFTEQWVESPADLEKLERKYGVPG